MQTELEVPLLKNGPYNVFSKILKNIDIPSFELTIFFVEETPRAPWVFNASNYKYLTTSGAMIEALFGSEEIDQIFVNIREIKNEQILLYRIIFSKDEETIFLSGEESFEMDSFVANEFPIDLKQSYIDSDFFQLENNEQFEDTFLFQEYGNHEANVAFLLQKEIEQYNLSGEEELNNLFDIFRDDLYDNFKIDDLTLFKNKDKFVELLKTKKYSNNYNNKIIEYINSYLDILSRLGLLHRKGVLFNLPLLGDVELIIAYKNGLAQMTISIKNNYIFYRENLSKGDNVQKRYSLKSNKDLSKLNNLIKRRKGIE